MATITRSARPHRPHAAFGGVLFWVKSRALIGRRAFRNSLAPTGVHSSQRLSRLPPNAARLAEDRSALYAASDPREQDLELGKIQNLRVAAAAIDGIVLEPGQIFSFWAIIGRPARGKGYVVGRELRHGCLIPTIAGGICQLTNALSRIASRAGCDIIERHRHSAAVDGLVIDDMTDATVFWNYLDFRFRACDRIRIETRLTATELVVRMDALP